MERKTERKTERPKAGNDDPGSVGGGEASARSDGQAAIAGLPPPPGLCSSTVELGGDQYLVLSFPAPVWSLPDCLSAAEREVALAVLRGQTNESIARDRSTSPRTVANQIAAIFTKMGVNSRIELAFVLEKARTGEGGICESGQLDGNRGVGEG